jgi:hypothetical protein
VLEARETGAVTEHDLPIDPDAERHAGFSVADIDEITDLSFPGWLQLA